MLGRVPNTFMSCSLRLFIMVFCRITNTVYGPNGPADHFTDHDVMTINGIPGVNLQDVHDGHALFDGQEQLFADCGRTKVGVTIMVLYPSSDPVFSFLRHEFRLTVIQPSATTYTYIARRTAHQFPCVAGRSHRGS